MNQQWCHPVQTLHAQEYLSPPCQLNLTARRFALNRLVEITRSELHNESFAIFAIVKQKDLDQTWMGMLRDTSERLNLDVLICAFVYLESLHRVRITSELVVFHHPKSSTSEFPSIIGCPQELIHGAGQFIWENVGLFQKLCVSRNASECLKPLAFVDNELCVFRVHVKRLGTDFPPVLYHRQQL